MAEWTFTDAFRDDLWEACLKSGQEFAFARLLEDGIVLGCEETHAFRIGLKAGVAAAMNEIVARGMLAEPDPTRWPDALREVREET